MTRSEKILEIIASKRCDAAVFSDAVNVRYISGYNAPDGVVVITKGRSVLLVDQRYDGIMPEREDSIELIVADVSLFEAAANILTDCEVKTLAYDTATVICDTAKRYKKLFAGIKCIGISGICREMRAEKDEYELSMIEAAQRITEAAFDFVLGKINPDMTENELAAELEYFIRRKGAGIAFATIAVSRQMSAIPHGTPRDVKLGKNTFITMDFGAVWNGYCSDMTRTIAIGAADDEMKCVYNTVLEAQLRGISAVKAGVPGYVIDAAARDYITLQGYGQYFTHSLGHSVGLQIHEAPGFSKAVKTKIPENAVVTVEPGIYIPGKYGVRIEDMVVVTKSGARNLTKTPKELLIL